MIASFLRNPKLWPLLLALSLPGCVPAPYGAPRASAAHPIITSGIFTLPDGARLPYRLYPAQGPLKAVVLALHGYTDSRDAWVLLAQTLNARGIALYAPDQSGFGATANRGAWPGSAALVDEARAVAVQLREKYPHTRLVLMGESMGGGIGLLLGASPNPPPVDAYVLSAPAVWRVGMLYRAALFMADALAPQMRLTGHALSIRASDNTAALIAFGEDPLTIRTPNIRSIAGLTSLMAQAQAACAHFRQPALILYGGHDQLIPKTAMRRCWRALPPGAPVILAYYPPDYHMIPRDLERATPSADILGYILGTGLESSAPSAATVFLAD